ncbi:hypothetical protein Nepgr_005345 [Nepenthes gracilis]|uniref:Uncharacterized protein n=1 Tax=Nepenthes gracilis TaxID=150966 RepID=A0AAD3S356_NEPGR|nr:hypothetical protein Nepgr_005345 [Nepenthes gracilis]
MTPLAGPLLCSADDGEADLSIIPASFSDGCLKAGLSWRLVLSLLRIWADVLVVLVVSPVHFVYSHDTAGWPTSMVAAAGEGALSVIPASVVARRPEMVWLHCVELWIWRREVSIG